MSVCVSWLSWHHVYMIVTHTVRVYVHVCIYRYKCIITRCIHVCVYLLTVLTSRVCIYGSYPDVYGSFAYVCTTLSARSKSSGNMTHICMQACQRLHQENAFSCVCRGGVVQELFLYFVCMKVGLFCGCIGLFCGCMGLFCGCIGLFRGWIGLFCGWLWLFRRYLGVLKVNISWK